MVESGQFLEWAHVFGRRYGTLENEVRKSIDSGCDVLLDIDWQGTQQLKQVDPDIVRVFILPPSMKELERRLRSEEHTSELQSLMRISYAVFCLKQTKNEC